MTSVYKLIFDLSLYYTLSGFYIRVLFRQEISGLGMMLLCLTAVTYLLLQRRAVYKSWCNLILLLPAPSLFVLSGWCSGIQLLLGWSYLAYCLITEKTAVDKKRFQEKFKQGYAVLLLIIPGLLLSKQGGEAFVSVIGYLLVQMISGICCLRTLREGSEDRGRQGLIVLSIAAVCAVMTLVGMPQLLIRVLNSIWSIFIKGLSLLAFVLAYGIIWLMEWLVSLGQGQTAGQQPQEGMSTAEILGVDESLLMSDSGKILWFDTFGHIVLSLLIVACVILLFRSLTGHRDTAQNKQSVVWSEEKDRLVISRRKRSWSRPKEPRKAIRYYYCLFLRECRRRGIQIQPSNTNREIAKKSTDVFGSSSQQLGDLYTSARYNLSEPVTSQQVKQAAKLWQTIKRTKDIE